MRCMYPIKVESEIKCTYLGYIDCKDMCGLFLRRNLILFESGYNFDD